MKIYVLTAGTCGEGVSEMLCAKSTLDEAKQAGVENWAQYEDMPAPQWNTYGEFVSAGHAYQFLTIYEMELDVTLCRFCLCQWEHGDGCQCQNDE